MIPREKEQKLISLYFYICDLYENGLKYNCQRFSNNSKPEFTDQEIMTIYLFAGHEQRYFQINEIYSFTKDYLLVSKITFVSNIFISIKFIDRRFSGTCKQTY